MLLGCMLVVCPFLDNASQYVEQRLCQSGLRHVEATLSGLTSGQACCFSVYVRCILLCHAQDYGQPGKVPHPIYHSRVCFDDSVIVIY
jgi:hypothetical protein